VLRGVWGLELKRDVGLKAREVGCRVCVLGERGLGLGGRRVGVKVEQEEISWRWGRGGSGLGNSVKEWRDGI
jgi:hypothetical protein